MSLRRWLCLRLKRRLQPSSKSRRARYASSFRYGRAQVQLGNQGGFIDKDGKYSFQNSLARVAAIGKKA